MRVCSKCRIEKPLSEFNKKSRGLLQPYCKGCNSEYLKAHYAANPEYYVQKAKRNKLPVKRQNRELMLEYLSKHPCVDCGETDPVLLTFDHVRGTKSDNVAKLVTQAANWDRVMEEVAKCEVRCVSCHVRRTAKQFNWYAFMEDPSGVV